MRHSTQCYMIRVTSKVLNAACDATPTEIAGGGEQEQTKTAVYDSLMYYITIHRLRYSYPHPASHSQHAAAATTTS